MPFVISALTIYAFAVLTPGPSALLILRSSASGGAKSGALAAAGTTVGVTIYAVGTCAGLGVVFNTFEHSRPLVQCAGGLYLVYLGLGILHAARTAPTTYQERNKPGSSPAVRSPASFSSFWDGLLITILNPKTALFFVALFAPALDMNRPEASTQVAIIVGVILIDAVYHQALARAAARLSNLLEHKRTRLWLDGIAGCLMITIGGVMLASTLQSQY